MRETRWGKPTEEEIDEIAKLMLTRKYSGKQIAEIVGRSKGSIMGIIWRTPRLKEIGLPNDFMIKRIAKAREREARLVNGEKHAAAESVIIGPRNLMQLKEIHCKFPMWAHEERPQCEDMLFCSEARLPDSPYCAKHHKLCVSAPHTKPVKVKQIA
jgi:hypothetical protein